MSSARKHASRRPVVFVRPLDGQSLDDIVDALREPMIDWVNERRKGEGLPPLPKETPRPSARSRCRSAPQ
jgi:hypothetical protein